MAFEEEFGISIEVNESLKSVGDVVDLIESLANNQNLECKPGGGTQFPNGTF